MSGHRVSRVLLLPSGDETTPEMLPHIIGHLRRRHRARVIAWAAAWSVPVAALYAYAVGWQWTPLALPVVWGLVALPVRRRWWWRLRHRTALSRRIVVDEDDRIHMPMLLPEEAVLVAVDATGLRTVSVVPLLAPAARSRLPGWRRTDTPAADDETETDDDTRFDDEGDNR